MQVGLSLGPSFAELCVTKPAFFHRAYLPKENLTALFQKLREAMPGQRFDKLVISCRYLEKIFETKLGGSVAQIVTSGFETWPVLRQPVIPKFFVTQPLRGEPLASQELIFGIPERINARGEILKPLDYSALEFIAAKLKLMEVNKVCVNLLFAAQNPVHQNQVKNFFLEKGYEVFCSDRPENSMDEVKAWRNNILNACLSGTFLEILGDIEKATKDLVPPDQIFFLDSEGRQTQRPLNQLSSILFGWTRALPLDQLVLNLGLESWALVYPDVCNKWKSPWGSVEVVHRRTEPLCIQPAQEIETDFWDELSISSQNSTFEPGPMTWGRARKPLLADLLIAQIPRLAESFGNLMSPQGRTRYQEALRVLQKSSQAHQELSIENFEAALMERVLAEIEFEIPEKSVVVSGFFAEGILPLLKRHCPQIEWKLLENSAERVVKYVAQV